MREPNGNQCGLVDGFIDRWDAMTYRMFMLCTIRLTRYDLHQTYNMQNFTKAAGTFLGKKSRGKGRIKALA